LNDAMAASAALFGYNIGGVDNSAIRAFQILAGVGLGKWFPTKKSSAIAYRRNKDKCVSRFADTISNLKNNVIEITSYFIANVLFILCVLSTDPDSKFYFALFAILVPVITLPSVILYYNIAGKDGNRDPTQLAVFRYFSQLLHLTIIDPQFPKYVYLSDPAFLENLALMPLLRRQCKNIIVCDSSTDSLGTCEDLFNALEYARKRLFCKFSPPPSTNNSDIHNYLLHQFVYPHKKRSILFHVAYLNGTIGKILYLKPRNDDRSKSGPFGCCCNCCDNNRFIANFTGEFPNNVVSNVCFSPSTYEAYENEGILAYKEAKENGLLPHLENA